MGEIEITTAGPSGFKPGDVLYVEWGGVDAGVWVVVDARDARTVARSATRWERARWWLGGLWARARRVVWRWS